MDRVRQALRIYCDVPFDPRNFFARIIALFPGCISILDALGINDTKARPFALSIVYTL